MDTDSVMMEKCEDPRPASPAPAAAAPGRGSPWSGLGAETRERQRPGAGQHNTLTHLLQQHNGAATMVRTVSSWDYGVPACKYGTEHTTMDPVWERRGGRCSSGTLVLVLA